jgi:hypothetical protein
MHILSLKNAMSLVGFNTRIPCIISQSSTNWANSTNTAESGYEPTTGPITLDRGALHLYDKGNQSLFIVTFV